MKEALGRAIPRGTRTPERSLAETRPCVPRARPGYRTGYKQKPSAASSFERRTSANRRSATTSLASSIGCAGKSAAALAKVAREPLELWSVGLVRRGHQILGPESLSEVAREPFERWSVGLVRRGAADPRT